MSAIERMRKSRQLDELAEAVLPLAESMASLAENTKAATKQLQETASEAQEKLLEVNLANCKAMDALSAERAKMKVVRWIELGIATTLILVLFVFWRSLENLPETLERQGSSARSWTIFLDEYRNASAPDKAVIDRMLGWEQKKANSDESETQSFN